MTALMEAAMHLAHAGLSVVPVDPKTKKATREWKAYQTRRATEAEIRDWFPDAGAIAMICGAVSGNAEAIDFDQRAEVYARWAEMVEEDAPGLVARLHHQRSQSGGRHAIYRCEVVVPGNTKLARRPREGASPTVLVETRGEGGYILVAPSPGYEPLDGVALIDLPVITAEEREVLIRCARGFDEVADERQHGGDQSRGDGDGLRPGDDFNRRGDVRALLQKYGWTPGRVVGGNEQWRRPGKTTGKSASLQTEAPGLLYVFSANAAPFQRDTAYTPFSVCAILEHGGDYSAAARALAEQGYGTRSEDARPDGASGHSNRRVEEYLAAAGLDGLADGADLDAVLAALARLREELRGTSPAVRAMVREAAIRRLKELGFRSPAKTADEAIGKAERVEEMQGAAVVCEDAAPWPEAIDGAALLDAITSWLLDYVSLPAHAEVFLALWLVHTHAIDAADVTPYPALSSPTKKCGKTTLLRLLAQAAARPLTTANISSAALFRTIEKYAPTLFIDEADTVFRPAAAGGNDDLRCIMNAGFERGASVLRVAGESLEPRAFRVFCPKAIALIGTLPPTLQDRSVDVRMDRKSKVQRLRRARRAVIRKEGHELARKAARWARDNVAGLRDVLPALPEALDDRAQDIWEPLLAIAEAVGGAWVGKAQAAAEALSGSRTEDEAGLLVLSDLRDFFATLDRAPTETILDYLHGLQERRWGAWHRGGKKMRPDGLADLLKPFGIRPRTIRLENGGTPKGYLAAQFREAWTRYLLPLASDAPNPLDDAQGPPEGGYEEVI